MSFPNNDIPFQVDGFWHNFEDHFESIVGILLIIGLVWGGYAFRQSVMRNSDQIEQIDLHFDASGAKMMGLRYGQKVIGYGDDERVQRGAYATVYNGTKARIQLVQGTCRYVDPTGTLSADKASMHDMSFVSDEDIVIKPGTSATFLVRARESSRGAFYDLKDLPNQRCEIKPMFVQEDQVKAINWKPLP